MDADEAYDHLMHKLEAYRKSKLSEPARRKRPAAKVQDKDGYETEYEKKQALRLEKERKLAEYKAERRREKKAATLARRRRVLAYQKEKRMRDQAEAYKAERERREQLEKEKQQKEEHNAREGVHCYCGRLRREWQRHCDACARERRHRLFEMMQPTEQQINSARCRVIRKGNGMS